MYYYETCSTDPAYNLAFEEYVLKNRRSGDILILWQNANAVIVGRNQNALEEIDRNFVEKHRIKVIRRNTGGGAVYHDMGNLNYSFITDADDSGAVRFTAPIVRSLQALGLEAEASGRNDILVSGKKISGTAQHRHSGRILHHGTLLFDSNPDMIAGALRPDPTKFQSKGVKSVRSRVGNIREALNVDMTLGAFWDHLKQTLTDDGLVPMALSEEDLAAIRRLRSEKYDTWAWNFGSSPKFATSVRRRFPGGLVEVHLTVKHGRIDGLQIYGDFLALEPLDPVLEALRGCPYEERSILLRLQPLTLSSYLGAITAEELTAALLNN